MVKTAQTSLTAFGSPAAFFEMELMCLSSHVFCATHTAASATRRI